MSDPIREVLTELLRLYDWRFALAEREAPPQFARTDEYHAETKRLLNQYGREKKAAWLAARAVLAVRPEVDALDEAIRDGNEKAQAYLRRAQSAEAMDKLLRGLLDRIYKMSLMAIPSLRLSEQDQDSNDPLVAWMSDARLLLYGSGRKPDVIADLQCASSPLGTPTGCQHCWIYVANPTGQPYWQCEQCLAASSTDPMPSLFAARDESTQEK